MYTTLISPSDLLPHLHDPDWVIVDCRYDLQTPEIGRVLYQRRHIPGAVYAHLDEDLSSAPVTDHGRHPLPTPEGMIALFRRLGINNHSQVVAYDIASGSYAARLWWMLRYMGHEAVAVLEGGWTAWAEAGYLEQAGVESRPAGNFNGAPRRDRLVVVDDLATVPLLVDARDEPRFRGEAAGLDPKAGHIPGAVSYYYGHNLQADNRLRPASQLRTQFQALLGVTPAEEVVFYCGSGVLACFNILAQVHAGLPEGKVYIGSWSEWSRSDRPIETSL